jgi:hypothetical protein
MIDADTLIWTKRGWLNALEVIIGDTVISYNPSRNCTEYDQITDITIDYGTKPILGLKTNSMNMCVTPDHPIIIKDKRKKEIERKIIDDVFLFSFKSKTILYTSPFEPYLRGQDLDDIAWSARVASSFGNVRYMSVEYFHAIWNIVNDLSGIEAQHWIDIFFHWGVLQSGTYWSKAIKLRNRQSRDIVYHIAPRAGFGARFMPNPKKPTSQWIMGLSVQNNPQIMKQSWYRNRIEGYFFNIKTKNGSFLARKTGGTFLCASDIT